MAKKNKEILPLVQFLTGNSYESLFINGELISQGHTVHAVDILEELEKRGLITLESFELVTSFDKPVHIPGTLDKARSRGIVGDAIDL
jgi:hypothetical protein